MSGAVLNYVEMKCYLDSQQIMGAHMVTLLTVAH